MQWTVRFFLYKCKEWQEGVNDPEVSDGARAYAVRQRRRWKQLADGADSLFTRTTVHYVSPLRNH